MKKLYFGITLIIFCFAVFIVYVLSEGPETQKQPYKIGILNYAKVADPSIQGFKHGMTEHGYLEGKDIIYLYEGPIGNMSELISAGKRLIAQEVDLIYSPTTPASQAAKQVTEGVKIPVVIGPVSDAVGVGLTMNLNHSDVPRLTGVVFGLQEEKRMEWLLKLAPKIKRIYVPYNANDLSPQNAVKKLRIVADRLHVRLIEHPILDLQRLTDFINNPPVEAEAIYLPTDSLMASKTPEFAEIARKKKLPLTCPHHPGVEQGALFSFGFKHSSLGKQASRLAAQILQGISPADLPIEHAEFYLTVNLKTAKDIGIHIPDNVLRQADTIIK
ncbi:ABC transporter substrate-binding protein [bacterium]|nr:ABC transporter substrate-binding protein [bacterium]